jgi:hypothetical protein
VRREYPSLDIPDIFAEKTATRPMFTPLSKPPRPKPAQTTDERGNSGWNIAWILLVVVGAIVRSGVHVGRSQLDRPNIYTSNPSVSSSPASHRQWTVPEEQQRMLRKFEEMQRHYQQHPTPPNSKPEIRRLLHSM